MNRIDGQIIGDDSEHSARRSPDATSGSLELAVGNMRFRPNGVEFETSQPLPLFREFLMRAPIPTLGVTLEEVGTIVGCEPNASDSGYVISLLFIALSPKSLQTVMELASVESN